MINNCGNIYISFFLCVCVCMSHIVEYEFNTNKGLVIDKGKWSIKHISTRLDNSKLFIILRFIGPTTIDVIVSPNEDFVKVLNTEFSIKIKDIIFNMDISQDLIIEIENDSYMDISCNYCQKNKIRYTYFNKYGKSFNICSKFCLEQIINIGPKHSRDEENIEGEPKSKKTKTIPLIDILLIGVEHSKKEFLLDDNLLKSLNEYSDIFNKEKVLVKQLDNKYITSDRKPFLIFWESKEIYEHKINIKDINGKDSKSWHLPAETESITCFQYLESSFYTLLFPVRYNKNNKPEKNLLFRDNTIAINLQNLIAISHGHSIIDTTIYGTENPLGCETGWVFIRRLYTSIIINRENNIKYLETILPDSNQVIKLTEDIKVIMDKIIETQLSNKRFKDELDKIINNMISQMGGNYDHWYNLVLPQKKAMKYRNLNNSLLITSLINKYGDLSSYYNDIKKLIIQTWTIITSHVNPISINYGDFKNISIDINYDNKSQIEYIDNNYFTSIIEKLKNELSIDIPTLLFKKTLVLLEDGVLLSDESINKDGISPFLQLRDIIFFQNMTNICLSTNIKRCIVLYGEGHIKHIKKILNKQQNIKYNIESYELSDLKDYKLFNNDIMNNFSNDTKIFINEISNKLLLYFIYEKIDYWLWEKEQYNDKLSTISNEKSENKRFIINEKGDNIRIKIDEKLPKFQIFSKLIDYWHENQPDSNDFSNKYYYTIGRYIFFIIYHYIPYFTFILNNYIDQYNNYHDQLKTNVLEEFKGWFSLYKDRISDLDKYMPDKSTIFSRKIGYSPDFGSIKNVFNFDIIKD